MRKRPGERGKRRPKSLSEEMNIVRCNRKISF
jgi:hypothetical protein